MHSFTEIPVNSPRLRGAILARKGGAASSKDAEKDIHAVFQRRLRKAWFSLRSRNQARKNVHATFNYFGPGRPWPGLTGG